MENQLDIEMLDYKLRFLYNALEVDIDSEGVFASFIWDEFDEQKYEVIAQFLWGQGLNGVGHEVVQETQETMIYGFFEPMEEDGMTSEEIQLMAEEQGIDIITERKTVIKVNAKGKRRRKVMCGTGKKWDGKRCVAMNAKQKLNIRKGKIKARRTQKAKGSGKKRKTAFLRKKAMKKRGQQGLK